MKKALPSVFVGWFIRYAARLEHPTLFKWICAIFLVNLFIPDPIPLIDEFLLGLATLYLGSRKKSRREQPPTEKAAGRGSGEKIQEESGNHRQ